MTTRIDRKLKPLAYIAGEEDFIFICLSFSLGVSFSFLLPLFLSPVFFSSYSLHILYIFSPYHRNDDLPSKAERLVFHNKTSDFVLSCSYDEMAAEILPQGEDRHIARYLSLQLFPTFFYQLFFFNFLYSFFLHFFFFFYSFFSYFYSQ